MLKSSRSLHIIKAIFAFIILNLLFIMPSWFSQFIYYDLSHILQTEHLFQYLWVSVDLLLIVIILGLLRNIVSYSKVISLFTVFYSVLFSYEIYRELMLSGMNRAPLLFNDVHLLVDSYYLAVDLFSVIWVRLVFAVLALLVLFIHIIPNLFRHLGKGVSQVQSTRRFSFFSLVLLAGIILSHQVRLVGDDAAPAQFVTTRIKSDIATSVKMMYNAGNYEESHLFKSAFSDSVPDISHKPDIYFFLMESYGKILAEDPQIRREYAELMTQMNESLHDQGWAAVTNYSRAPVTGGSSWLSALTLLSGKNIDDQYKYGFFTANFTPDLITFIRQNNYHSVLLQPPTRERPGLPVNNLYKFDSSVLFNDLEYSGKKYGWGIIPDQYSLWFVNEKYFKTAAEPVFFFFTMVSSHVPWDDQQLPPFIHNPSSPEILLSHYTSDGDQNMLNSAGSEKPHPSNGYDFLENYLNFIAYDVRVIKQFVLNEISSESLIVIIGDHQPPILKQSSPSYQTPVHIISQNQHILSTFKNHNFIAGMTKHPDTEGSIAHEDLSHILIEALTENDQILLKNHATR